MTKEIDVLQTVEVTVDEAKFTPEFMEEFRQYLYDFDTVEEHIEHIAQLAARGVIETPCFIEGYGDSQLMGIKAEVQ